MTSRMVADALLRDLSFCDGAAHRTNAAHAFRFALDFEPERVWPDLAFDTSSPLARYPVDARDEVTEIVGAVARVAGTGAPKALDFINTHMETALVCRSGAIDGASTVQITRHVILPLLGPTIRIWIFLSVIGSLQLFDVVWIMTEGGPANASSTMVTYLIHNGFNSYEFGYGSAVAVILFILCFAFALLYQRFAMRRDTAGAVTAMAG